MKFNAPRGSRPHNDGGGYARPKPRPDWFIEWLANQGRWCLLSCGHYEDLNSQALLIINTFSPTGKEKCVFCERCNDFVGVRRGAKFDEAVGFTAEKIGETPLF